VIPESEIPLSFRWYMFRYANVRNLDRPAGLWRFTGHENVLTMVSDAREWQDSYYKVLKKQENKDVSPHLWFQIKVDNSLCMHDL
jgi:hypothetical protein